MSIPLMIILCSFLAASLLTFVVFQLVAAKDKDGKLRSRLSRSDADRRPANKAKVEQILTNLGEAAAKPFMPESSEKQFVIRRNLARAGIYTPRGIRLVAGAKVICLGVGLVLGYFAGNALDMLFLCLPLGGIVGYVAPMLWLKLKTKSNQAQLTNGLADALDLMVVCIEAGLTMDAALQRIGGELAVAHPSLSRELGLTHMETRVGLTRSEALRNMGQRTGNAALQSLSSMLIQAERFGTSIADALRVHAESLRINRQMAAEEIAGKASVKMSFPLVLCIFPCTFIVLAGPTVIQLMQSPVFK